MALSEDKVWAKQADEATARRNKKNTPAHWEHYKADCAECNPSKDKSDRATSGTNDAKSDSTGDSADRNNWTLTKHTHGLSDTTEPITGYLSADTTAI